MARPQKSGLDYFPLDSDFFGDPKIEDLLFRHGTMGLAIFLAILCRIYREGYYLASAPEQITRMVIKDIGGQWIRNPSLVSQVIRSCAELGLFEPLLVADDVFTSAAIQKRYAKATARNKGKMDKYCLLASVEENGNEEAWESAPVFGVSATETPISATETPVSATETHMKEKKIKENKREEERGASASSFPPSQEEIWGYAKEKGYSRPLASRFFAYYSKREWRTGAGRIVRDWQTKLDRWAEDDERKKDGGVSGFDSEDAMRIALERSYGNV
jgi:hypothetical protein